MRRTAFASRAGLNAAVIVAAAAIAGAFPSQTPFEVVAPEFSSSHRVNVALGVMSRCPDALFFETSFDRALGRINEKVSLDLTFIAHPNSSASFGATCMHGEKECEGNVHQLCVIDALDPSKAGERYDLSPSEAQKLWWSFVQCEIFKGGRDQIGNEDLAKECLNVVTDKVDWKKDGIQACVKGKRGIELLRASIEETHRRGITKSATLQIEGKTVCIRDDGKWKDCEGGHEPGDWVRQIDAAYEAKNRHNAIQVASSEALYKRQAPSSTAQPPPPGDSNTATPPPPSGGGQQGNGNGQNAPLSVFTFVIGQYLTSFVCQRAAWMLFIGRIANLSLYSAGLRRLQRPRSLAGARAIGDEGHLLIRRQSNGQGSSTNFFSTSLPAPFIAFGVSAIALFVLVVSFVLLRIFVRNRRLRRMGIYPDGPIDRLLGGNIREFEDTLPQPKLWHANIADVRAGIAGASSRAEKSALGGGVGAGDVKQHGWDALMPVSAAFPPNLYPVIYANDGKQITAATANADSNQLRPEAGDHRRPRLTRHMPHFLRRNTEGAPGDVETAASQTGPEDAMPAAAPAEGAGAVQANDAAANDERLAASVNVTVLIAMPSTRTVFPSSRRIVPNASAAASLSSPRSNGNFRAGTGSQLGQSRLDEVQEDAGDAGYEKGKARRAPSLKSMKSTTSVKSLAEARREAFFAQMKDEEGQKQNDKDEANDTSAAGPADTGEDAEEEELPELVFGTASVPLFARFGSDDSRVTGVGLHATELATPAVSDILDLISWSKEVRQKKLAADEACKKADDAVEDTATIDNGANARSRVSNAETSIDGPSAAVLSGSAFYGDSRAPLGDVVQRMLSTNSYEMNDLSRPSMNGGPSRSFLSDGSANANSVATPNTISPLVEGREASGAATPIQRPRDLPPIDTSTLAAERHSSIPPSPSAATALSTMDDSRRHSTSTWHTGHDDEDVDFHETQSQVAGR